jgi:hypothetical protein
MSDAISCSNCKFRNRYCAQVKGCGPPSFEAWEPIFNRQGTGQVERDPALGPELPNGEGICDGQYLLAPDVAQAIGPVSYRTASEIEQGQDDGL